MVFPLLWASKKHDPGGIRTRDLRRVTSTLAGPAGALTTRPLSLGYRIQFLFAKTLGELTYVH